MCCNIKSVFQVLKVFIRVSLSFVCFKCAKVLNKINGSVRTIGAGR